ncbi:MAG: DUF3365 domain-containing protein, partial [Burkholderiales bacterium]
MRTGPSGPPMVMPPVARMAAVTTAPHAFCDFENVTAGSNPGSIGSETARTGWGSFWLASRRNFRLVSGGPMSGRHSRLIWIVFAAGLAACEPRPEQPAEADIQAARKAAVSFDIRMKREITDRLERGEDPVAVYLAYADNVPGWGLEISNAEKIDFSRTAITVRNPANSPDAWEMRQMELFNLLADGGQDPESFEVAEIVSEGDEKVFRWMRPTLMGEACMACHGEAVSERIKLLLGQEYPLDDALGYSEGQLGGAYSVRKVLSVDGKEPPPYVAKTLPQRLPADQRRPD